MDVGIFYEIQVASPLKHRERENQVFHQVLDQAVAAEQEGFDSFSTVEHHFQPGFAHASAPEALYGAVSQHTAKMLVGHGVVLLPFPYNHLFVHEAVLGAAARKNHARHRSLW
jgi:alkanesulfonate monooxygenase SsuD/methylene tetrahydromethanopterin reductase-like flavin-dependent oxidoreductase (luciferase family)